MDRSGSLFSQLSCSIQSNHKNLEIEIQLIEQLTLELSREKINNREGQPAYTYNASRLVDTMALYIYIQGHSLKALFEWSLVKT